MSAEKVTMSAEKVDHELVQRRVTMGAGRVTMSAEKGEHECREG